MRYKYLKLRQATKDLIRKNGAISIEVIFIIIIVTTSIFFLLALFSNNLSGFSRAVYCKTVFYVQSSDFMPERYRQDPQYCNYSLLMRTKIVSPQLEYISEFPDKKREIINNFTEKNLSFVFNIPPNKINSITLEIKQGKISDIYIKFCNASHKMVIKNKLSYININKDAFKICNETLQNLILNISGSSEYAKLSDLRLVYSKCYPNEEVLSHILACWERVNYGNYAKNKICEQFMLSKDCNEVDTSENIITGLLIGNNVCQILGNNDTLNCGEENNLDYNLNKIEHNKNYIIEFNSRNKKIIVS